MKVGDLVRVNNRCNAGGLWYKTGIVLCRVPRHEPGKHPLVRVLLNKRDHLFDYCSLDVISESR